MLVHGDGGFIVIVGLEGSIEPMGEASVDALDRFPESPPAQSCPAASGVVGNRDAEALIGRPSPERSLS